MIVSETSGKLNLNKAIIDFSKVLDIMPRIRNRLENGGLKTPN